MKTLLFGTCLFVGAMSPCFATPVAKPDPAIVAQTAQLMDECLTQISDKSDDKDTTYFENGVWVFPSNNPAYSHQSGAATGAALLWKWRELHKATLDEAAKAKQDKFRALAIDFFDHAIKDRLDANGMYDKGQAETEFFGTELSTTYLTLKDSLPEETRVRWLDALTRMVNRWIKNGDFPDPNGRGWKATDGWYTNGNFEMEESELIFLMAKITGEQKYKDLFETQWKHTLSPSPERWGKYGYGLFYIKQPTKEDGSDGSAYLAEAEQEPGFDKDYAQVQLSMATRLFVVSKDARVLRVMNLIFNSLEPRVDEKTWILDATYGSRHSLHLPFFSTALPILAFYGGRTDLAPKVADQFDKGIKPIHLETAATNIGNPGIYSSYGSNLGTILLADMETP